ncbi:phosphoribosyltransferase [Rhodococcus sp. WMMA185]|uniref:ComF family protein n=1 Tax=Rhodococcus sp. WMMA185 TaxID=679318 RepID=UPI000878BE97|nr:ComF family protein [Rhodococcus sp. WMMA185]AOW92224.1 phosphoribosyltransferase [Rhodococcus sp. WMMA185]
MRSVPGSRTLLDLMLPVECGGCAVPGTRWCDRCAAELADDPVLVCPRVDPGVPVWALGRYSGPRRRAVIAAKERGRRDLAGPLGFAVSGALARLRQWGELDASERTPVVVVPAPTRARTARARGGDPVTRIAVEAVGYRRVCPALAMRAGVRDSVGLSADQRRANLGGGIRLTRRGARFARCVDPNYIGLQKVSVVLLDDVATTGATATESIRVLSRSGIRVSATVVIAAAG